MGHVADGNRTDADGGAILVEYGSATFEDCVLAGNRAETGGGAWVQVSVTSTTTDWSENTPDDLVVAGESWSDLGEDATFSLP